MILLSKVIRDAIKAKKFLSDNLDPVPTSEAQRANSNLPKAKFEINSDCVDNESLRPLAISPKAVLSSRPCKITETPKS